MKTYRALIIGSGAAAYAAALRLHTLGVGDIAILTDRKQNGTSRNAGSDKQTYYKLSLCGSIPDSVAEMAQTLFEGGSVHGDVAYAEAAGSVRGFLTLCELGVPFPTNPYGEYVGYKTDHDPRSRGTSAGPLTSRYMTQALEAEAKKRGIPIFDGEKAVRLAVDDTGIHGVITMNREGVITPWAGENVVLATGGPAGIFKNVVYPLGQTGMTGLAIEAGAKLQNFAEWQFGIASTKFRWNLSGSYQQVIPRYLVLEDDGTYREFLPDYFDDPADMLLSIFLKGYQWPFAAKHVEGSSRVDMALFGQLSMGKRVFLDYMHNPAALTDLSILPEEAREYLIKSGSTGDTPFDRLMQMNPGAVDLYRSHDIHLDREYLEISLSAQHNNGGVAVDADWQSTIPGLFAAGEAAGTFGAVRPGGSALNSGQVGAIRLAEAIAFKAPRRTPSEEVLTDTKADVEELVAEIENASRSERSLLDAAREIMSDAASALRSDSALDAAEETITYLLATFPQGFGAKTPAGIIDSLVARDTLLSALALLSAEKLALSTNGSRGSALYYTDDTPVPENPAYRDKVMETFWNGTTMESCHIPVRPLPNPENWFEAVWKEYRETRNL